MNADEALQGLTVGEILRVYRLQRYELSVVNFTHCPCGKRIEKHLGDTPEVADQCKRCGIAFCRECFEGHSCGDGDGSTANSQHPTPNDQVDGNSNLSPLTSDRREH